MVPIGEPIRFNLALGRRDPRLLDPAVDYKHDLIPGSTQVVTLAFPDAGRFQGECAEFCGLRHADMLFSVHAVSPAAFAAWARGGGRAPTVSATAPRTAPGDPPASARLARRRDQHRPQAHRAEPRAGSLVFFLPAACSRC